MAPFRSPAPPAAARAPITTIQVTTAQINAPLMEKPATRAARPRKGPDVLRPPEDDWRERGACAGESPSLFFAPDHENPYQRRMREAAAKTICSHCPVRTACRAYAVKTGELYGIWGGTTERERAHGHSRTLHATADAKTAKSA